MEAPWSLSHNSKYFFSRLLLFIFDWLSACLSVCLYRLSIFELQQNNSPSVQPVKGQLHRHSPYAQNQNLLNSLLSLRLSQTSRARHHHVFMNSWILIKSQTLACMKFNRNQYNSLNSHKILSFSSNRNSIIFLFNNFTHDYDYYVYIYFLCCFVNTFRFYCYLFVLFRFINSRLFSSWITLASRAR